MAWFSAPTRNCEHILACTPPALNADLDHIAWKWSANRNFSLVKTYKHMFVGDLNVSMESDDLTWKMHAPQRARTFLWLLAQEKLLTNEERFKRGMSTFPFCERCGLDIENVLHVVMDCGHSASV